MALVDPVGDRVTGAAGSAAWRAFSGGGPAGWFWIRAWPSVVTRLGGTILASAEGLDGSTGILSGLQAGLQVEFTNQPVQVVGVNVQQFCGFRVIPVYLL